MLADNAGRDYDSLRRYACGRCADFRLRSPTRHGTSPDARVDLRHVLSPLSPGQRYGRHSGLAARSWRSIAATAPTLTASALQAGHGVQGDSALLDSGRSLGIHTLRKWHNGHLIEDLPGALHMIRHTASSAAETGYAIAVGADPVEILEETIERIDSAPESIFLSTSFERARREAEATRQRQRAGNLLGPLDGVPVAWKDLIHVAGSVTSCASRVMAERDPETQDAECVGNAAKAGMVTVGKTNLTEFAFSGLGINPHFGTPRNPWDEQRVRIPGGSSSGSAVAVALGLLPCAIGTDTGGSVRIPAAFNGIVGFKPTAGRIPVSGVLPLAESFDSVGPLCCSVEDCALLDAAMRGVSESPVTALDTRDLEILVPENFALDDLEDGVAANFERSLRLLEDAGYRIERETVEFLTTYRRVFRDHGMLTAFQAQRNWQSLLEGPEAQRMDPRVVDRMMAGAPLAERLPQVYATRRELAVRFESELGDRILLTPTTAFVAPELAPLEEDAELYRKVNLRTLRNTMFGNYLRGCGLSLPNGVDGDGMPTALLLTSHWDADDRLLAAGLAVERITRKMAHSPPTA